jgi:tryptophanyl-tRNA synthetase
MRVLSGIQPSGKLHLANYFGMMKRMIDWQEKSDLFCFVVDYHALTSVQDPMRLRQGTLDAVLDFLALGIDPDLSTFFLQSDVPEVTELSWVLSNVTPMGLLERCHSYKDKLTKGIQPHHGLFAYPVLMAADILLYDAERIPVGKDQKQHVEVARDIALKFNHTYGETFVLPEPDLSEEIATIPGIDGQKMSKSYHNYLEIFGEEKDLRKKVMSIVTDSVSVEEPKDPDKCNVYNILKLFLTKNEQQIWTNKYRDGGMGYGEVKKFLLERIWEYFAPYREKRVKLEANKDMLTEVLAKGREKAKKIAVSKMEEVRRKVGLLKFRIL